ncbi:oligogalacturonate lyase family protein [Chitinophagaceae bacterium LWZ2-11]
MKFSQNKLVLTLLITVVARCSGIAQPILETGSQKPMPDVWIDKDTHHRIERLSDKNVNSASFYFHNNPFIKQNGNEGDRMVFYANDQYKSDGAGKQICTVNLKTHEIVQLTKSPSSKGGEILGTKSHNIYYQIKDSVFRVNADTKKEELIFVFPADFKAGITTLNADETLLAGAWSSDKEKDIFKQNPNKSDYFNKIYEAKLPRTLFTINVKTKELTKVFTDTAWLNHVQFSTTDPALLMFCHEGPWHKVDRIWTIDLTTKNIRLMHKRTVNMEIAGHEWFAPDGKTIWFDLQMPRSENFYVGGVDVKTLEEKKYKLTRDEWSVHFTSSPNGKLFAGDGGDAGQVAKAKDGMWIYLFTPDGDKFTSQKLVNMKHHYYKFEPNVHFSPDGKQIIFRANFEGKEGIYAVDIAEASQK